MKSETVVPNPAESSKKETITFRTVAWLMQTSALAAPILWLMARWCEWQYWRQIRRVAPNEEAARWALERFRRQMERDFNA